MRIHFASRSRPGSRRRIVALTASIVVLVSLSPLSGAQGVPGGRVADTVFLDGKVLLYGSVRWAQAVAVTDGIISFVGGNGGARNWIGPETDVIDLDGKTLMPGLVDGHAHGSGFTQCSMGFTGGTVEQVLGKLRDCLLRDDQIGLLGTNFRLTATAFYSRSMLPAGTFLTRHLLDRLSADPADDEFGTGTTRPILVRDSDGHTFSTNTQAIVNAGLDENTPDPVDGFIGRDPGGYPNGLFADFSASWGPTPAAPPDSTYLARVGNVAEATRKGITSYMRPNGSINDLATWQRVADEGHLTVRINQAIGAGALRGEDDQAAIDAFVDGLNAARDQYDGYTSPNSPGIDPRRHGEVLLRRRRGVPRCHGRDARQWHRGTPRRRRRRTSLCRRGSSRGCSRSCSRRTDPARRSVHPRRHRSPLDRPHRGARRHRSPG